MPDCRGSKWARLCRKSEFAKRLNQDVARYCVDAGYPVMHLDQEVGGGYQFSACFSKAHGHPAGDGPWVQAEMEDLFKRFWKDLDSEERNLLIWLVAGGCNNPNVLKLPFRVALAATA